MNQSKYVSLIEQVMNVGSGFVISLIYWQFVIVPQLNMVDELTFGFNMWITFQFTVISVIRGYLWRRLFNTHKFAIWIEAKINE